AKPVDVRAGSHRASIAALPEPRQRRSDRDTGRTMSQENVDAVRSTFEAFQKRDLDAFLDCFDPDVEYRSLVLEVEGTYRGREGMRRWWDGLLDVFPDWNPQIVDSREVGRCVV